MQNRPLLYKIENVRMCRLFCADGSPAPTPLHGHHTDVAKANSIIRASAKMTSDNAFRCHGKHTNPLGIAAGSAHLDTVPCANRVRWKDFCCAKEFCRPGLGGFTVVVQRHLAQKFFRGHFVIRPLEFAVGVVQSEKLPRARRCVEHNSGEAFLSLEHSINCIQVTAPRTTITLHLATSVAPPGGNQAGSFWRWRVA